VPEWSRVTFQLPHGLIWENRGEVVSNTVVMGKCLLRDFCAVDAFQFGL